VVSSVMVREPRLFCSSDTMEGASSLSCTLHQGHMVSAYDTNRVDAQGSAIIRHLVELNVREDVVGGNLPQSAHTTTCTHGQTGALLLGKAFLRRLYAKRELPM
jgi:hypothetical protein